MKLIVAIIRPERLEAVQAALPEEACLLSVSQVVGDGRDPGYTEVYRGTEVRVRRPKLRLEIAVDDLCVEAAVDAILRAGSPRDSGPTEAKVFVVQLDKCVRIPHGERGPVAAGT